MALPNIQQSDVRFSALFTLNTVPKTLTIADLVNDNYESLFADVANSDFQVMLKVTSPSGNILYINDGWGSDDFTSPDIKDGGWTATAIEIDDDVNGFVETGDYVVEYKVSIDGGETLKFNISKTISLNYVQPTISVDVSYSRSASTITSRDTSTYKIEVDGVEYENKSVLASNRTHTLRKPSGARCTVPAATADASRTFGGSGTPEGDLWTGQWISDIETQVQYVLETWGGDDSLVIVDTVNDQVETAVDADDCICDVRQCVVNLINRYKEALLYSNSAVINSLREKAFKVSLAWMNYEMATMCGEDPSEYCAEIVTITKGEDCDCGNGQAESSTPQHIIPYGAVPVGGSGSGAIITHGSGAPTGGSDGDYHFQVPGFSLYAKVAGTWQNLGSFIGGTGVAGPTGPAVTGPTGPAVTGPTGPTGIGVKGDTGHSVAFTHGSTTPTGGSDGDYHFQIPGSYLWKRISGVWTSLGSFKGETGVAGPTGTGVKGDTGVGVAGPAGPTGTSITGPAGSTGPTGYVVSLGVQYGATTPTGASKVPTAFGQVYINTTTRKVYVATSISVAGWSILN